MNNWNRQKIDISFVDDLGRVSLLMRYIFDYVQNELDVYNIF